MVHRLKRILKVEPVSLPSRRRALSPAIQNLGEANRAVKSVKRKEAVAHWEKHQRAIATIRQFLRQRFLESAFHEDLNEHPHVAEGFCRNARQQCKLGDPRTS